MIGPCKGKLFAAFRIYLIWASGRPVIAVNMVLHLVLQATTKRAPPKTKKYTFFTSQFSYQLTCEATVKRMGLTQWGEHAVTTWNTQLQHRTRSYNIENAVTT